MLTQYGVCCFRYKDDDDKGEGTGSGRLEARPFNCFIVPSTKFDSDRVYSCQASSMDFLRYKTESSVSLAASLCCCCRCCCSGNLYCCSCSRS